MWQHLYGESTAVGMKWTSPTCGHKVSMWLAAIWTIFVPSSFVDNEQARLATLNKINKQISKQPCQQVFLLRLQTWQKASLPERLHFEGEVFCQRILLNKEMLQEGKRAVERGDSDEKSYNLTQFRHSE